MSRRNQKTSDSTTEAAGGVSGGVSAAEIESMIEAACEKAVCVLKEELLKLFEDVTSRLKSVEDRLAIVEQKTSDHAAALDDLAERITELGNAVDSGTGVKPGDLQEATKEIEGVRREAREAMCAANDVEQYGRRNNIRIRGLSLDEGVSCRTAVKNFVGTKLQTEITEEDIEIAHILPSQPSDTTAATSRRDGPPPIIVKFRSREVRDAVLKKRRALKGTRYTVVEDLTALNSKTLTRVSRDPNVASAWTWNGKVIALLKTGDKITVRPFQSLL